jgi:ribosomal protein S18 acetylase RimI-like enzyme
VDPDTWPGSRRDFPDWFYYTQETRIIFLLPLHITPLKIEDIPDAISLFTRELSDLKVQLSELPEQKVDVQRLSLELQLLVSKSQILAAVNEDGIAGYLGWYLFNRFREVDRRTAYSPDYAHAAPGPQKLKIYQALYNAASSIWFDNACEEFVFTLLANDMRLDSFWYWNGFGLIVVDAIRSLSSPLAHPQSDVVICKANPTDLNRIVLLDREHFQHYSSPPTLMIPRSPRSTENLAGIIAGTDSSIWLAYSGRTLIGFMSFETESEGATTLVSSDTNTAITSAYVKPEFRGKQVALGILAHALRDYSYRGFLTCSVDFESVNPYAAHFWMKYFKPVCQSVMRIPEFNLAK